MQTKLSKSLTLDNGTDCGDLPFHAAHAITVDGCIRLMQTKADLDQKTTEHNSRPSSAMVLKARQELSPLENSLADFTLVNSAKIEI